jgi:hypothetical protein
MLKNVSNANEGSPKKVKRKKGGSVQTVYKTLLTNLVRLTRIADQKAALMISVNSIIISLVLSFMFGQIRENHIVLLPTVILNVTCILAITYSIFATRPNTKKSKNDEVDLLFFGHFSDLNKTDYISAVKELMANEEDLQEKIISSIHSQGMVLHKKYKYLKTGYNIFMIGFPISVIIYFLLMTSLF